MSFTAAVNQQHDTQLSFEARLSQACHARHMLGQSGAQMVDPEKPKRTIGPVWYIDTEMHPDVFALGVNLRNMKGISPEIWTAWMMDAEIEEGLTEVTVRHRSAFYASKANDRLSYALEAHFRKPVVFSVCPFIAERVNKRSMS